MTAKLRDLFYQLNDRLSSPLIYSFIISWIVVNWKISIGLIFYEMSQLKADGYTSYIDLISNNMNLAKQLWTPLLVALAYTFLYPFLRNGILIFLSWMKSWGGTMELKVAGRSKVSMERFVRLSQNMKAQSRELEDLITSESELRNDRDKYMTKASQLEKHLDAAVQKEKQLQERSAWHFFSGDYKLTYSEADGYIERSVTISQNGILVIDPNHGLRKLFSFKHVSYNIGSNEFFWWIQDDREKMPYNYVVILRPASQEMRSFQDHQPKGVIKSLYKL